MGSIKLHAMILAFILFLLGAGSTAYQIWVQQVPIKQDESDPVWVLDAHVSFEARGDVPVRATMLVPPLGAGFTTINESFIANNYGVNVANLADNRVVTWSSRRATGTQNLYYRLMFTPRFSSGREDPPGPQFRAAPRLQGAERLAVESLLEPIRRHSADVETFITEAVKQINQLNNDNVNLLLDSDTSAVGRARVLELLLGAAHIPVEKIHMLPLVQNQELRPELWLRSYNGDEWIYFNPVDGQRRVPDDRVVWWQGDQPVFDIDGGRNVRLIFSLHRSEMGALQLAQTLQERGASSFMDYSMYALPLPSQELYRILLLIPIGVLVVLAMRSFVGIETLGTFTPVLIALAFQETQVIWGLLMFTVITAMGLTLRSYLEYLRLQLLARLSVVLTFVVIVIAAISFVSYKLGLSTGLSVALFPMVILTMVIERTSIVWEERGGVASMKVGAGTLVTAVLSHYVMVWQPLVYFVFTFPGTLLCAASIMILIGHYRGYRLTELVRFRAMAEEPR